MAQARRADGGRVAARGLRYQYVCTLEAALEHLADPRVAVVRVEGGSGTEQADAVDFDVLDDEGRCLLAAQIKSRYAPGAQISASSAFGVLMRLVADSDAERYLLRCAAMPGPGAMELAAALENAAGDGELRAELARVLARPGSRPAGPSVTALQLARLRRARLEFDTRTEAELSADLRGKLRAARNAASLPLGEHSAGLLAGFLIGEILRRAADEDAASFAADELRALVCVDARDLARTQAVRDWGVLVGAMPLVPDIERRAPSSRLAEALSHPAPDSTPRRVVLSGLSGIGKSSLAAAYIAAHADRYDVIFWVSAQNGVSLRAGFEAAGRALDLLDGPAGPGLEDELLRSTVHTGLSRLAGRWALVLDDASDLRALAAWMPRHGEGDILITTVNSAPPPTLGTHLPIGPLEPDEATELLARRLELSTDQRAALAGPLAYLAAALERWPLALELAAGYIQGCALPLDQLADYTADLTRRALDDEYSLPTGYPRTLAAAVRMNLRALLGEARTAEARRAATAVALAAYLAPRQIPVDLLGAAILIDEQEAFGPGGEADGHEGPLYIHPSRFHPAEMIRQLRRYSLAAPDEPLPPVSEGIQPSNLTIRVNTVVQEVVRTTVERNPASAARRLVNLASHTDRWFVSAFDLGDLRRSSVLFPHADSLARHAVRTGVSGGRIDTLFGNVATGHSLRGDPETAEAIMRYQLGLLARTPSGTPWKIVQAQLALAICHCRFPERSTLTDTDVHSLFAEILTAARELVTVNAEAAAHIAVSAHGVLDYYAYRRPETEQSLAEMRCGFAQLVDGLGETASGRWAAAIARMDTLLATVKVEDTAEAERICRELISTTTLNAWATVAIHRQLIETLELQRRWDAALEAFRAFRDSFAVALLPLKPVATLINNTGGRWALLLVHQAHTPPGATELVDEILAWPVTETVAEHTEPWEARRIELVRAIHEISHGRPHAAGRVLDQLREADLVGDHPKVTESWLSVFEQARSLCRHAQAVRPRDAHPAPDAATEPQDPWFDPEARLRRRTNFAYAHRLEDREPASLPILVPTALAVHLEHGLDRVPTVDIALTLAGAFAHLGIDARVRTAQVKIADRGSGVSGKLGSTGPRWLPDGTFTGHCILELPALSRVIAPTIEAHPLVRTQPDGPLVVFAAMTDAPSSRPRLRPAGPIPRQKLTIEREPITISIDLAEARDLDLTAPYITEHAAAYEQAGRDLASASINLLRSLEGGGPIRDCGNPRVVKLAQGLANAHAVIDDGGHWSFKIPQQDGAPRTIGIEDL